MAAASTILQVDAAREEELESSQQQNPFELGDTDDPAGKETGEVLSDVDSKFEVNFARARAIMIPPQNILQNLSIDKVCYAFLAMTDMWLHSSLPAQKKVVRNFAAFFCSEPPYQMPSYDEAQIESAYLQIVYQWTTIQNYLDNADVKTFNDTIHILTDAKPVYQDPRDAIRTIASMSFYARQAMFSIEMVNSLSDPSASMQILPDEINYGKFSYRNNADLNRMQKAHLRILRIIERQGLRRVDRDLYCQIVTEQKCWIENGEEVRVGGDYTHAWKHHQSIDKFVGAAFKKDEMYEGWKDLTSTTSFKPLIEKLVSMTDIDFPELEKDRHWLSFSDGIYDVRYDDFYHYNFVTPQDTREKVEAQQLLRKEIVELEKVNTQNRDFARIARCKEVILMIKDETRLRGTDLLPSSLVTANFIEDNFVPPAFANFAIYANQCRRANDIFTPAFDRVLDHQQFYDTDMGLQVCSTFCCGETAQFAVRADSRPRFCARHMQRGMVDKLVSLCSTPRCTEKATWWQSKLQAKRKGLERQKFCELHKQEGHEEIPDNILNNNAPANAPNASSDLSVKTIFYAMIGRLFFNVGELDKFQVIPFIKGLANTGKSTLIKFFQKYYSPEDVQVLSNNVEKRFGLEPMMKKFLFVAPEIKDNFGLDQAEFQSMVSGDPMSVSRKFKLAVTMTWVVPGILAGNTPPKWADKSGSITRRVLTFPFLCPVRVVDPSIETDLEQERGVVLRKCVLAYHSLIDYVDSRENKNIWSIMPQKLLNAREDLQMSTNVLGYFLKQNNEIVVDTSEDRQNQWVPWDFFVEKLHAFNIRYHQPVLGKLDPREFVEVFATMNVEMVFDESSKGKPRQRQWSGEGTKKPYKSPFLYGMRYRVATDADEEEDDGNEQSRAD